MKRKTVLKSIREQIYEAIRESIVKNSYAPGEELQMDRLAEEFGVSSTPIREALIQLESGGLVTLIPNKGARVTAIREADVRNTWEMRKLLEPYAARIAATFDLDTELDELAAAFDRLQHGSQDVELYIQSDIRLHELLYIHLTNDILRDTLQNIHQRSMRMRYSAENVSQIHDQVIGEVLAEHKDILQALREKDGEKAAATVRYHLENGERRALLALAVAHES